MKIPNILTLADESHNHRLLSAPQKTSLFYKYNSYFGRARRRSFGRRTRAGVRIRILSWAITRPSQQINLPDCCSTTGKIVNCSSTPVSSSWNRFDYSRAHHILTKMCGRHTAEIASISWFMQPSSHCYQVLFRLEFAITFTISAFKAYWHL